MFRPLTLSLSCASILAALLVGAAAPANQSATPPAQRPVSFNRDIRPIMSDTCFLCHGPDAKSRKAGMRLDIREQALKPTKNDIIPIVPGKPEESEIIFRIMHEEEPMPPEDSHKKLTPEQKELFRRWVAEGAVYEPHWAYTALVRPEVPGGGAGSPSQPEFQGANRPKTQAGSESRPYPQSNPIDAFIRAKLAEKNIAPSPEAPKARLLRRLELDLTGLPPTPEEVAAFLADKSPNAYEKQVDRLLASPHHGERMAVWWLDIARYADTVGFHGDQNQRIFPYRDYVINAFNTNKRFDQFTTEQLAGDLLPNPTPEQLVATGYNRLNMMTREGGAQPKEYLAKYGAERVRSVSATWFGSTFGCAECHDHKFDPIKSRDFYELQSFFADMKQWGVYSDYTYTPNPDLAGYTNDHPFPPELEVNSPYLAAKKKRLETELTAERKALVALLEDAGQANGFNGWLAESRTYLAQNPSGWSELPVREKEPAEESISDGAKPATKKAPKASVKNAKRAAGARNIELQFTPGRIAALRLELTELPPPDPDMKKRASRAPLKFAAAVRGADGKERKLNFVFADGSPKEPRYEGGAEVIGILSGWKVPTVPSHGGPPVATWLLATPQVFAEGDTLVVTLSGEEVRKLRVFTTPFGSTQPLEANAPDVRKILARGSSKFSAAEKELLATTWLLSTAADRARFDRLHMLAARIRETRDGRAMTLITEHAEPITVRVLPRGNWQDETAPIALPATPSFLPNRKESTPDKRLTRLDLARWIVSAENPITARTVVNRLWAMFFGTGLSAKLDDLGSQGEAPSHPELLDWLASEFRDSGWDMRHVMRLIVTSATYRQNSNLRPELREIDPANRLLASQNPRRLEAEFVRDNALFIAGALNLRDVGGPSVKPYQPPGYYAALQFPDRDYVASADDEQWRRGVYMHWQRTYLHPMLANFDAPSRDECTAQRTVSNTPQQALTLLNDPEFVEAARLFAARVAKEAATDDARFRRAYLLAVAREPKPAELASLKNFLATQREYYRANAGDAEKILRIGFAPPTTGDAAELAAWTQVARVILNSHEVITRY